MNGGFGCRSGGDALGGGGGTGFFLWNRPCMFGGGAFTGGPVRELAELLVVS